MIIERLKAAKVPVILVVNKIDKVHPDSFYLRLMTSEIRWTSRKLFLSQPFREITFRRLNRYFE